MFLTKEQVDATVAEYGLDVSGMNWPQKQGFVSKYLAAHDLPVITPTTKPNDLEAALAEQFAAQDAEDEEEIRRIKKADARGEDTSDFHIDLMPKIMAHQNEAEALRMKKTTEHQHFVVPQVGEPVIIHGKAKRIQLDQVEEITDPWLRLGLANKRVMFTPELLEDHHRALRYEEDLGQDFITEEVHYGRDDLAARNIQGAPGTSDGISGTYKLIPLEGKHVTAISSLPKYGSAIYWDFGPDGQPRTYFPIVEFRGERGYLYRHHSIPNVYSTIFGEADLRMQGYYQRFRPMLSANANPGERTYVFYLAGILCIDIDFTHYMMNEISKAERERKARDDYGY